MRLTHFYFLTKESDGQSNNSDQVQLDSYSNPVEGCSNIKRASVDHSLILYWYVSSLYVICDILADYDV